MESRQRNLDHRKGDRGADRMGKSGTPKRGDELILFEVTFCAGKGQDREAVTSACALR